MARALSKAETKQRQSAALKHGGRSQVLVRQRAGYIKQGLLQPLRIRHDNLSPVAKRYLDLYARVVAKIELYDAWAAEHGYLNEAGESPPWAREYAACINSASRLLSKLDQHLYRHQQAQPSPLERHLEAHYIVEADGDE